MIASALVAVTVWGAIDPVAPAGARYAGAKAIVALMAAMEAIVRDGRFIWDTSVVYAARAARHLGLSGGYETSATTLPACGKSLTVGTFDAKHR